jgi:heat shock protein HspQ
MKLLVLLSIQLRSKRFVYHVILENKRKWIIGFVYHQALQQGDPGHESEHPFQDVL